MPCHYTRPAWRSRKPNENGKYPITFQKRGSQLTNGLEIPCGKCIGCRADQAQSWGVRLYHEASLYSENCFLTLTYNQENCPSELDKPELQKFFKRLRRHQERPLKYFAVGEYGSQTRRPHYHAIIFGTDYLEGAYSIRDDLYGNRRIDRAWGLGEAAIADAGLGSIFYVAGYTQKKLEDPDTFNIMSKGRRKATDDQITPLGYDWCKNNLERLQVEKTVYAGGRCYPIPPAYFEWFPDELADVKEENRKLVTKRSIPQQRSREINQKSRMNLRDQTI